MSLCTTFSLVSWISKKNLSGVYLFSRFLKFHKSLHQNNLKASEKMVPTRTGLLLLEQLGFRKGCNGKEITLKKEKDNFFIKFS